MTALILDGRSLARELSRDMRDQVIAFRREFGYGPVLAIVRVGNDLASISYARQIDTSFTAVGFGYELEVLDEGATQQEVEALIQRLARARSIHGIVLQRPLPGGLSADAIMTHLPAHKDVEGVTPQNIGKLALNSGEYFRTSTPSAAIVMLQRYQIPIQGRHAVVVGRSTILGRPMSMLLLHENATVTTCHSRTPDLADYTRQADILVAAAGRPRMITRDMVKPGAAVIDFGVNFVNGKMVGDVDFEPVKEIAGAITPVPGGAGPITTVMLMRNTLEAAHLQVAAAMA